MAITIRSSFMIDADPADVWRSLIDIELSAPCFPGAELKEKQSDGSYKGSFSVKLGPLLLKFAGKFKIAEQHDDTRTAIVAAGGTDTKGRGGAEALIHVDVLDQGGKSKVDVVSNVNLSGTVAQYGRGAGMIEALSQQLLDQFAKNLATLIETPAGDPVPASATATEAGVPPPTSGPTQPPPPSPAVAVAPLDAGSLLRKAMWQSICNFFARLFGIARKH
jgi:carbon monoxide dehydrogenase subunit G